MQLRNAPCPCGSGRRFKHCHGQLAGDESASRADTVDFVIAGAQRAGTTALDLYLREHSGVAMARTRKELHFFDDEEHFRAEPVDYAAYHENFAARMPWQLRGEATPSYMYWDPAAARMARYNPALKIIIVLRNPITRAHSHWNKERQRGRETLPFLEALRAEPERARAALPLQIRRASYVDRGFYTRQLRHLWRHFPVDQTLILRSEALQTEPEATLKRIGDFLGLGPFPRIAPKTANMKQYERPISLDEWEYLAGIYAAEIRELERLLEWDCSQWQKMPRVP
jgi:sulfotransferase family protein/SEC-C motif-containing protein